MINILIKIRSGSTVIEFSIFLVVLMLAFLSMQAFLKRGVQGGVRRQIDQFAPQFTYEYGNVTTRTIETSSSNGTESGGFSRENVTQAIFRTTDEDLEASNVETRIGLQ